MTPTGVPQVPRFWGPGILPIVRTPIHNSSSDVRFVTAHQGQVSWTFMGAPLQIQLSNLGMADSLILMVLALVVFGPRRLPQIGRQIGKLMYEFRKASNDFKFQMEEELRVSEDAERRKKDEAARAALPPPTATVIDAGSNTALLEQASVSARPSVSDEAFDPGQPTLEGQPSPYHGESTYPSQYPPETTTALSDSESHVTLPRTVPVIQPPTIGQQVPAPHPQAGLVERAQIQAGDVESAPVKSAPVESASVESASVEPAARLDETLEANLIADPAPPAAASPAPPHHPAPSETVTHHG